MQNFVKTGHMRYRDFLFLRWPASTILNFEILNFLVDHQIGRPNMHRCTKLIQNQSNGCWDIAFNSFQNGGRPPSWIFKSLIFEQLASCGGLICAIMQNFVKIGQKVLEISWFFDFQDGRHLIFLNISWGSDGQYAWACKISSKSVEPLMKYSNLWNCLGLIWRPCRANFGTTHNDNVMVCIITTTMRLQPNFAQW